MKNWLIVSRDKYFDLDKAFDSYMTVTWPQVIDVLSGDTVYIYEEGVCDAIKYKCIVEETDLSTMDDSTVDYVWDLSFYDDASTYMRLRLNAELDKLKLSRDRLEAAGISIHGSSELSYEDTEIIEDLAGNYSEINNDTHTSAVKDRHEEPEHKDDGGKGQNFSQDGDHMTPESEGKYSEAYEEDSISSKKSGTIIDKYGWKRIAGIASVCVVLLLAIGYFTIHIYEPADCEHPETCKICGKTRGVKLGHKWDSGKVIEEAGCEKEGKKLYTCKNNSSHTREETIPARGHSWKAADCENPETCTECGETRGTARGHDWIEATYDAPMTCRRCGETTGLRKGIVIDLAATPTGETYKYTEGRNYFNLYPNILNKKLTNCRYISILYSIDCDKDCTGTWRVFFRSNGKWVQKDTIQVSNTHTLVNQTTRFEPAMTIDAIFLIPANVPNHEFSWKESLLISEAQVE